VAVTDSISSEIRARHSRCHPEGHADCVSQPYCKSDYETWPCDAIRAADELDRLRAREILLSQALEQAQHTVEFIHGCLVEPEHYKFAYPEHTARQLEKWARLAPKREGCHHSFWHEGCSECDAHREAFRLREWAKEVLREGKE